MLYFMHFEVDFLICPCFKAKFKKSNKEMYIIFHLFSESEGDMEEEREDEEDPDWIEEEVSEVSESDSEGEMESEDTDVVVSVDPVPSSSHATDKFYNPARSRRPLRVKRVPASRGTCGVQGARDHALVAQGSTRGRGARDARGGCRARNSARDPSPVVTYKSNDDEDEGNPCDQFPTPPFRPARPPGIQFEQPLPRGRMHTAVEFFKLFFTEELVNNIVKHTSSYAVKHITGVPIRVTLKQMDHGRTQHQRRYTG